MRRSVPRARPSGGGSVPYQRSGQLQRFGRRVAGSPTYGRPQTIRDSRGPHGPANVLIHSKLCTGAYLARDADLYRPTERTKLRRLPERGAYDRQTAHAILDEGFICHVGFLVDGQPFVIPTGYARVGDTIYLHGSSGSRLGLRPGMDVCVTVTLLEGLVLARSAFHHCKDGLSTAAGEAA
jgi:Pyridoxamine 5'-phosphate oxidase